MKLTELTKTCDAMPAQWEGKTDDGHFLYVRYRHGCLEVSLYEGHPADCMEAFRCPGECLFCEELTEENDGFMERHHLEPLLRWLGFETPFFWGERCPFTGKVSNMPARAVNPSTVSN